MLTQPPLSLYIHLPWCVRKCPYCDFNSFAIQGTLPEEGYIDALERDLRAQAQSVAGRTVETVFFGGGTPSLFAPQSIARILQIAQRELTFASNVEITLEANPGTIERGVFSGYRAAGVNRVSLGGQSFAPQQLKRLGRVHQADDTIVAAKELHAAGIQNFNIDLMYGLPQQTIAEAVFDVEQALALGPSHLSHYQLTLEPGTVFAANPPAPPHDDTLDLLEACAPLLKRNGFEHYEISAYATPGARARHNLNYWQFADYLGIGAGAHGKLTAADRDAINRTTRPREPRRYMADAVGPVLYSEVSRAERPFEFMLNALRLVEGFEQAHFEQRTGLPWSDVETLMNQLLGQALVENEAQTWRTSARGGLFLNDLLTRFIPDAPRLFTGSAGTHGK